MRRALTDLLVEHGALSLEKQDTLGDLLGEHRWDVDLPAGTVDFGGGRVYPIQVLGSESTAAGTWLWAWANEVSNIPHELLQSAVRLREFGASNSVSEFSEAEWPLEGFDAHVLGMVACGLCGADAYYIGHHPGGAVLLLLSSPELAALRSRSGFRVATVFAAFLSGWEIVDQQRAFVAYLSGRGMRVEVSGGVVSAEFAKGGSVRGEFDAARRLVVLKTRVPGEE